MRRKKKIANYKFLPKAELAAFGSSGLDLAMNSRLLAT